MTPDQAPPGVTRRLLPRPSGTAWKTWLATHPAPMTLWESRPIITPRLLLVHTNGATGEGTAASAYNWSMSADPTKPAPNHTMPHYQVDRDGTAVNFLPTDRKAIGNYLVADFSIVIETADLGWPDPGPTCGFTPAQAEMIAWIIAWESERWNFPIAWPDRWDGSGVACHTEPFGFPFWTNSIGKPCPGLTKKIEMREIVMPRAQTIRTTNRQPPPSGDDDMTTARMYRDRRYWNVWLIGAGTPVHLTPALKDSYDAAGVPMIVDVHEQLLKTLMFQCGLTPTDLVPSG